MQRIKRLVPIVAILTLAAAPAAIAPAFAQGQAEHQMGATSPSYLFNHAYKEALHAHEAAALGMNDMATNHLENVRLTMAMIDPQRIGMNQGLQQQMAAIRESVENIDLPSDRGQATQNTQRVVSQFVAFYNRAPQGMGGGGGGAAQQAEMQPTVFDFSSMASTATADVQASILSRDWAEAQRHAQDAVNHLDKAIKAAEAGPRKLDAALVRDLRSIRQDANQLLTHTRNKNQQANEAAGKVVNRLGTVSPRIAVALTQQGGGAGQPQKPQPRR